MALGSSYLAQSLSIIQYILSIIACHIHTNNDISLYETSNHRVQPISLIGQCDNVSDSTNSSAASVESADSEGRDDTQNDGACRYVDMNMSVCLSVCMSM